MVKNKKINRIISLVIIMSLILGTNLSMVSAASNGGWKVTTKTVTEGNITTTTETMKKGDIGSLEKKVNRYVTDNTTKETVLYGNTTYEIGNNGIKINLNTKRDNINTNKTGTTIGDVEGVYDVTQYIKANNEDEFTMEVREEHINKLFDSIMAIEQDLPDSAQIDRTITLESKLENIKSLTFKVPTRILSKIYKDYQGAFKMQSSFGYMKLDHTALGKILNEAKENVIITLNKIDSTNNSGLRTTVNNGNQIISLNEGTAEIGVKYSGAYGLDSKRIKLLYVDGLGKETEHEDGIEYNIDNHMITYKGANIGEYNIVIAPVIFSDTDKHWAKDSINRWSDLGVINGYNGKFSPNANIKRGDMATIIGRIVNADAKKLERANEYATREEVAALVCEELGFSKEATSKTAFADEQNISTDKKGYIYALSNRGYMQGYNGNLNPKSSITRAEVVTMFNNIVADLVNYGSYSNNVTGNLLINGDDTVLKNMTVNGDVIISSGVGDGDVSLEDVNITGKLIVKGGGSDSIHIKGNSKIAQAELKRNDGAVRVVCEGTSQIDTVAVKGGLDSVILEGALSQVNVENKVPVKLNNLTAKTIKVVAPEAKLTVDSMSHIEKAELTASAKDSSLDISGEVKEINSKAQNVKIEGSGAVDTVIASANNITIKTNGTVVKADAGVTGTIAGKESVEGGNTSTTPGKKPGVSSNGKVEESVSPYAPTIKTTLQDGKTVKGSKITFDLWATDTEGKKISSSKCLVTLNGEEVKKTWEDTDKTSYTLQFEEGKNEVVVSATAAGETTKKTYTITYKPANDGTVGEAYVAIELFSLGGDYLIAPTCVDIMEGENAAMLVDRILSENGFSYTNTGKLNQAFYLASVTGGDVNNPDVVPLNLDKCPDYLQSMLNATGFKKGVDDPWTREEPNSLGEFDYTHGSGWMYCVNNVFPNVGFADYYLQDGDVMRIQFTLAYGADIGGASAMGSDKYGNAYWETANKDAIAKKYADREMPDGVLKVMKKLNATQSEVDSKR
ncbi:MAG: S-layer homology domain-containing protein [Aminipila sp.]